MQGTVKVNGWNRNEVRVFVEDGSPFTFKILEKSPKSGDPVWVSVTGIDGKPKYQRPSECLDGGDIEIDVPKNATINIKGQEATTTIDSVRKANVRTIGGDITFRHVTAGITASAGQGDITVEESDGAMALDSTTGNIVVFEAQPSEIGDPFKARTNGGNIALQGLGHRQVEISSISGSVAWAGEIRTGGSYFLSTSKGSIRLSLPTTTACKVVATYANGSFNSEVPFKLDTENIAEGPVKNIVGQMGKGGDAVLKLSTNNGSIAIKKQ